MTGVPETTVVIGCHRSGTTVFMRTLSFHPSFSWISQYNQLLGSYRAMTLLSRIHDLPLLGNQFRINYHRLRLIPKPVEPGNFAQNIDPNFHILSVSGKQKESHFGIPSIDVIKRFRAGVIELARCHSKKRFIAKFTTRPDVIYFKAIFPNANFIHILRDPRAVVNSLRNRVIKDKWFPPSTRSYIMNIFPNKYSNFVMSSSNRMIAFLSCYYCYVVNMIQEQLGSLSGEKALELEYKDFTTDTVDVFRKVLKFLNLPWNDKYERFLLTRPLENRNYKYKRMFTREQLQVIEKALHKFRN